MDSIQADVVIIGSGVGGSAVAHRLVGSGARVLMLGTAAGVTFGTALLEAASSG